VSLPNKPQSYNIFRNFYFAFYGILSGFAREVNLWVQLFIGLITIFVAIYHQQFFLGMLSFILMIVVMGFEMLNTAFETLCDLVHPSYHEKVKVIKDLAAGAVLMMSLAWLSVILYGAYVIFVLQRV
jgi:diacylglycerol kinase (ATP)